MASSKPSTLMETKKFPHAQHLLTEVLVDERAVGKRIHPRLRRPVLRLRVQEKTGGRHKITLQTGKQGHEQIRRDLRAGEKENDMLYSEKMKATDKGGCRPSFKKTKGVSDMDRIKKNFGFGCITTASSIPRPAAERPTVSNAANAKRSVPSICPSAGCSRMWRRNLKKPDIFRRENDPENRPAALRSAADPVLLGRRPRCPGTAHRAQISEDCRRSRRRCC